MIIKRSPEIEEFFLKTIQDNLLNKIREGIHVSDLLSPKQAYWRKTKPLPATKSEIIYWLSGQAHESALLHITQFQHGKAKQWNEIWYTPDVFLGFPIEAKTTRRGFVVKEGQEAEKYAYYLKQLQSYCALEDSEEGWLFVWYLVMLTEDRKNTDPDYFAYEVIFTREELEIAKEDMLRMKEKLTTALNTKNPETLPDCEEWMCFKIRKHMIMPPYCFTCKKEFKTDWGINKHIDSKTGKGHSIKKAEYEEIKEVRCKYSEWCKPDLYKNWIAWKEANQNIESEEE